MGGLSFEVLVLSERERLLGYTCWAIAEGRGFRRGLHCRPRAGTMWQVCVVIVSEQLERAKDSQSKFSSEAKMPSRLRQLACLLERSLLL